MINHYSSHSRHRGNEIATTPSPPSSPCTLPLLLILFLPFSPHIFFFFSVIILPMLILSSTPFLGQLPLTSLSLQHDHQHHSCPPFPPWVALVQRCSATSRAAKRSLANHPSFISQHFHIFHFIRLESPQASAAGP